MQGRRKSGRKPPRFPGSGLGIHREIGVWRSLVARFVRDNLVRIVSGFLGHSQLLCSTSYASSNALKWSELRPYFRLNRIKRPDKNQRLALSLFRWWSVSAPGRPPSAASRRVDFRGKLARGDSMSWVAPLQAREVEARKKDGNSTIGGIAFRAFRNGYPRCLKFINGT